MKNKGHNENNNTVPEIAIQATQLPPGAVLLQVNTMTGEVSLVRGTGQLPKAPLDPCQLALCCEGVPHY